MSESEDYTRDKKWINKTLESLLKNMDTVMKDIVSIQLQIKGIVTRMSMIMGFFMLISTALTVVTPYYLDYQKQKRQILKDFKSPTTNLSNNINSSTKNKYLK